jgi:hypothetical protein
MTLRDEILKVGLERGWTEESPTPWDVLALRWVDPDSTFVDRIEVRFGDGTYATVTKCVVGTWFRSSLECNLKEIQRYIRWRPVKIDA